MTKNIIIVLCFFSTFIYAQDSTKIKYVYSKLSVEPALGTRVSSMIGAVDLQLSGLVQYNLHPRFHILSHTAISYDIIKYPIFNSVSINHSMTIFQKIGFGTSFYTKKMANSLNFVLGIKYFTYSAETNNESLEDKIPVQINVFSPDYGLMYNLKVGRKKYFFSGRIYAPVFNGKWFFLENANIELGFGIRLK
ncbi:MAG: hypothetical protein EAZ53_07190 [Bacteroidetes bacterium]|nr:MAG: hypothetical protein EAZ53_07190 [Bacteroidota bacterium]